MNALVCLQMLTFQLPQSVKKGSIHDSSQNIRELTLCHFFFFFFSCLTGFPFFIYVQDIWWGMLKKQNKKNLAIFIRETACGKEKGKLWQNWFFFLRSAKKLYLKNKLIIV